jgi:hypothetical protein
MLSSSVSSLVRYSSRLSVFYRRHVDPRRTSTRQDLIPGNLTFKRQSSRALKLYQASPRFVGSVDELEHGTSWY